MEATKKDPDFVLGKRRIEAQKQLEKSSHTMKKKVDNFCLVVDFHIEL